MAVLQDGFERIRLGHVRARAHVQALPTLVPVYEYSGSRKRVLKLIELAAALLRD
jgi:hypothetical protein